MNRIRIAALAGLLLLAAGCSAPPEEAEDGYQVYYSALEDRYAQQALASEPYGSAPPKEPIPDLVAALLDGPDSPDLTSPFPDGVRLLGWELEDGVLHLDLSEQYGGLSGVNLTVADACLTLTLCQVEGVDAVYVTVEGREIPYRPVQALPPEELFLSDGRDAPASVTLPFWYPRADGTGLAAETRELAAGDTLLHKELRRHSSDLPDPLYTFQLPAQTYQDGTLSLRWQIQGTLSPVSVSELWIRKNP